MGILNLLFPGSSKKIYLEDFRKTLRKISDLSDKERTYVEQSFAGDLEGGLSEFELKERCRRLTYHSGDILESSEIEKIKEKLLKYFE